MQPLPADVGPMGRNPHEILIGYYQHTDCYRGGYVGETVSRLLRFSVDACQWVGATWEEIEDQVTKEVQEVESKTRFETQILASGRRRRWFWILFLPPFWPLLLLVPWPRWPTPYVCRIAKLPQTFVFKEGVAPLKRGLQDLVEKGLVVLRDDVYYPTPALIKCLPHPSE